MKENNYKNLETCENKLFIYENLLKEKQCIIVNLKSKIKIWNLLLIQVLLKKKLN